MRTVRTVGGMLAVVWLGAGVAAVVVAVLASRRLLVGPGLLALWYGVVWARAVQQGRLLEDREWLWPWRAQNQAKAHERGRRP